MASFFGEMAKSTGGALMEYGEDVREERLINEDAQREMQLAKMRMNNESTLLDKRIASDDKRASRREEFETTMYDRETTRREEEAEAGREADVAKYEYEGQIDLATAGMNAWTQQQKGGVGRGNGWTTFTEQGFDNETGAITTEFYAQRDGITYRQLGDKYVEAGSARQPAQFDSIETQREAENKLWSGEATAQQFKDTFGYVPASYVTGQVAQGSDLGTFLRQNQVDFTRGATGGGESRTITPLSGEIESIVDQSAAQYGVDKNLILSVMDVESGGEQDRATATSTAGARGHMQLMPATAEELGVTDITAPGQNIPAGTAYLAQMMEKYGGNVAHALAAYNAGPTRVDKALQSGGDWINQLPPETRAYLPKALGRYYSLTQGQGALTEGAAAEAAPAAEPVAEPTAEPAAEPVAATPAAAPAATPQADLSDEDAAEIARIVAGYERSIESAKETAERAKQTKYPQDPLGAFKEVGDLVKEAIQVEHPRVPIPTRTE